MSLRLRLTLINGLVLLLVIGALALVVYLAQASLQQRALDASLSTQAHEISSSSQLVRYDARTGDIIITLPEAEAFAAPDFFIQVIDLSGKVIRRSNNLGSDSLPVSPEMLEQALAGEAWVAQIEVDGQPLRMYVSPLNVSLGDDQVVSLGMVQVARPLGELYSALGTLQSSLLGVGLMGVLVSLITGWLLARAALQPIDRLAATAHAIGAAQDFARRVPTRSRSARDEVGRLADEFNGMLARLQAAYDQLEAALAAQRRFVADASHELRTPLTSLRGNVDLLRRMDATTDAARNPANSGYRQLLDDMASETERMTRLVGDLLLLAQADAGQHLTLEPVAIAPIAREAFRTARFLKEDVHVRLEDGQADGEPWLVRGDADRLKQLLLILLDNALKYTPTGGTVTLRVARGAFASVPGIDGVLVQVVDTGCGIPPEEQVRIFQRFYRSDPARANEGGAGLGLAIACWIVEEHGGEIRVESAPGQGSTFTVWLPIVNAESSAGAEPTAVSAESTPSPVYAHVPA